MVMYIFFVCYKLIMQVTLYTNGQKTPTSTTSVGDGIVATTSAIFVTETTTGAEKQGLLLQMLEIQQLLLQVLKIQIQRMQAKKNKPWRI